MRRPARVAEVIRGCCAAPAILTGLSIGELLTHAVAIRHPASGIRHPASDLVRLAIPMVTAAFIDGFPGLDAGRDRHGECNPENLIAQWQTCLGFDCREALADCPVPIHAIGFTEDVQTPQAIVREVAERAANWRHHEVEGLGHVSFTRHAPDRVAAVLRQIIDAA